MGKLISKLFMLVMGWKVSDNLKGELKNDVKRCVMIASPHTSNWDLFFALATFSILDVPVRFTVKKEWLKFPFKSMMLGLGAIGIDRSPKKPGDPRPSMTESMIELFEQNKELAVMVTPEGTRSLRTKWKTGFYHVAVGAKVPIGLGYLDYANKVAGVGRMLHPSGDMDKDLREIMAFYKDIKGKNPDKFSIDLDYA
jgi:1-acyl-sn-glycerol-3-phosphate acyltransferase